MSFDKADILARLQKGETIDEIADAMSTALNEAEAAFQEEQIKASEANRVNEAKSAAVNMILAGLADYCAAAGKEEYVANLAEVDEAKIMDLLDQSLEFAVVLEQLKEVEFPKAEGNDGLFNLFKLF